jgi:5-methylcytosine-specific restriction endonuclease McrA
MLKCSVRRHKSRYIVKKQLFEKDSTCKLCQQQIQTIDDAEVDHIIPYSEGGKTEISNAQLTH